MPVLPKVTALDPGSVVSALTTWDGAKLYHKAIVKNEKITKVLSLLDSKILLIEELRGCRLPVGGKDRAKGNQTVLLPDSFVQTIFWSGRFAQAWEITGKPCLMIPRKTVVAWHCGSVRCNDSDVRGVIIQKYGKPGTKAAPGLTYGLVRDLWQSFAIVTYYIEKVKLENLEKKVG